MTAKSKIVERLGERTLLLPSLLTDAFAANDRIKLRLTLLQEAVAQAGDPSRKPRAFDAERQAAGLDHAHYAALVTGTRAIGTDRLLIPGARALIADLCNDLAAMLAPIEAADPGAAKPYAARLVALRASVPAADNDQLDIRDIDAMTAAQREAGDGIHLLVMDLHKALNRLSAETAIDAIDGARVHHITAQDRARVKAFMAGLNRTAVLAFGHPGLGTTAARSGARLTIQNDIGTTDAHVIVIHVEEQTVTITYTDVHRTRAEFFISLFAGRGVEWNDLAEQSAQGLGKDSRFYLVVGRFRADGKPALNRFLDLLGSRIVFLIDWNKARKALQTFVDQAAAVDILTWAAAHDYGHRAFLELGGVDLVFEAIRRTGPGYIPYGARLDTVFGAAEAADFLRRVLRRSSEGLRSGRSVRLIRDEIQADLAQHFETAESAVLAVLVHHLGLARMLAGAITEVLPPDGLAPDGERQALVLRAKRMEEKADRLTVSAREICARVRQSDRLRQVTDEVENATDALDECAFLLSLVPETQPAAAVAAPLRSLADIVVESIGHLVRAVEAAAQLPQTDRADAAESFQAIDAVTGAERRADIAERDAITAVMRMPGADARTLVLGLEIARTLETATDHLAHAALSLRDRVLEALSA